MCQYHAGKKNVNKYNPRTVTNRLEAAGLSKHNKPLTLILTLVTWTISLLLKNMLTLVFPSSVMYAASTKIHTWTGTNDKHTGTVAQVFLARLSLANISLILGLILAQCSSLAGKLDCLVPWMMTKSMLEPSAASDYTHKRCLSSWTLKRGRSNFWTGLGLIMLAFCFILHYTRLMLIKI